MQDTMKKQHVITIHVNEQRVEVTGPKATGLEIKQAAIDAGLPIEVDFVLSEERPNGRTRIVGDEDEVVVNPTSRFLAVAPDDAS